MIFVIAVKLVGREAASRFCLQMALKHAGQLVTTGPGKGRRASCEHWTSENIWKLKCVGTVVLG